MVWAPGDEWPGTAGGAARPEWSGYVRVYLWAEIAGGTPFVMGPDPADKLNAGNVMSLAGAAVELEDATELAAGGSKLWVDITCDLVELEVALGTSSGEGILSKSDAGTLTAKLFDPDGKYDPLNPDTPFALGNKTRLAPGVRIQCFAETIRDPTATPVQVWQHPLFSGTADRWLHDWSREPADRVATLVATDPTKQWVRFNKPALAAPVGQSDSALTRLSRIAGRYGWTGTVQGFGVSTITLQSTTLANNGWEDATRVAADELGFLYFSPTVSPSTVGVLVLAARALWFDRTPVALVIGCGPGMMDIATEVAPASFDDQLKNAVYAARTGGAEQTALSQSSIDKYGEQSLERTDLGLEDDAQVGSWASTVVQLSAYPQTVIDSMTLRPDVDPQPWLAWRYVLGKGLISGTVRVVWDQAGYTVDTDVRVVGTVQHITPQEWSVEWRTVGATVAIAAYTLRMGPDANDLLDAGYVMG